MFVDEKIDLDCEFINGYWDTNNANSISGTSVKDSNTLRYGGKTFIYKVPDFSNMSSTGDLYLKIVTTNSNGINGRLYYNEYHILKIFDIFHNHNDIYYSKSEIDNKIITDISGKEDSSNKVTSLSENSTNTQYPSAKAMYDELMTVRTVTPTTNSGGSSTRNNVTKNWHYSRINSSDLEYFERIVYNITFEDNDFQMFYQVIPSMGGGGNSDIKIIYFDGTDCYWGIPNNDDLTKGSLICEGNTIQATLNKDRTVTIGDTITNWEIGGGIIMFGNVNFTYTIYSHKYLDNETFPYVFEYQEANKYSDDEDDEYTINSTTKNIGEYYFNSSSLNNIIETTYTFTFNDNDFSFLQINYDHPIFFDGTDCYWGEWDEELDENDNRILNKGTLICEGNIVQAVNKSTDGSNQITFSDGTSTNLSPETYYFGDVSVKIRSKAPKLEYAQNKKQSLFSSYYDESIVYPSVSAVKNYAEDKSNKTSSWNSTTNDTRYPTEKLVKDSLDGKQDKLVSGTNLKTLDGISLLGEGDITIDVSCGDSYTILFEDDCSEDNTSDYTSISIRNTSGAETLTFNSTESAYACSQSNSGYALVQFGDVVLQNKMKISADIKLTGTSWTSNGMLGFCDKDNPTNYGVGGWVQGETYYRMIEYYNGSELQTTANNKWNGVSTSDYNHHELVYEDGSQTDYQRKYYQ